VNKPSNSFILYGTTACHLCELAEELLLSLQGESSISFEKVDIANSNDLFERYGVRIPVLKHPDGTELDWPFSAEDVLRFSR